MTSSERARIAARSTAAMLLAMVIAATIGGCDFPSRTSSSPASSAPSIGPPVETLDRNSLRAVNETDGVVPDGITIFDSHYAAVTKLDPALLHALRQAATAAARNKVTFYVDSGWRSPAYQQQLLNQAISKYGSEKEASRWVATPNTSAHVSGNAIDIGHAEATTWLSKHGSKYGLCQIYKNEPWHYELRSGAIVHGCPNVYVDPTQDPRMQQ